jgi:hypothetical protein
MYPGVLECTIKIRDWNTNKPSCILLLQPMQMFKEIYKFEILYVYLQAILFITIYNCHRIFLNGNCPRRGYETTADGVPRYHKLELHFQFHTSTFLIPPLRCRTRGST